MLLNVTVTHVTHYNVFIGSPDNKGREFMVTFMANRNDKDELTLFVTTSFESDVTVVVTAPGNSADVEMNEVFTVTAGYVHSLVIDVKLRLTNTSMSVKGVLVVATEEVSVYGINRQKTTADAFLAYPIDVLGKEYYTLSYAHTREGKKSQFAIIGVYNNTFVSIKLPRTFKTESTYQYQPGDMIELHMDRYETYQFQNEGDLSGTHVIANQPIAVFSGNDDVNVGNGTSRDHMVSQLLPVEAFSTEYITMPIPHRISGDVFKVVGSENLTTITIICNIQSKDIESFEITLPEAGDCQELSLSSDRFCNWRGDKPFIISQFLTSQQHLEKTDPAMIVYPGVNQLLSQYIFTTPQRQGKPYNSFFLFALPKSDTDGLLLDGEKIPNNTQFYQIGNSSFVCGSVSISEGFHNVTHVSPLRTFLGVLYGEFKIESYAFVVGSRLARINTVS